MELKTLEVVDVNRVAVVGDDVAAGARVVDVGFEAIDDGHMAVDVGHDVVDEDDVLASVVASSPWMGIGWTGSEGLHGTSVTCSPSPATAISSVNFSSIPAALSLFFKFPGSLASFV